MAFDWKINFFRENKNKIFLKESEHSKFKSIPKATPIQPSEDYKKSAGFFCSDLIVQGGDVCFC